MSGGRPNRRVFFASIGAVGVACARRPFLDEHPFAPSPKETMTPRPAVVAFDVVETLFALDSRP